MSRRSRPGAKNIYAYYLGEELLVTGTVEEVAEVVGVKPVSILGYSYDAYKKKNKKSKFSVVRLGKVSELDEI